MFKGLENFLCLRPLSLTAKLKCFQYIKSCLFKTRVQKPCPIWDQCGQNRYPLSDQNSYKTTHTYITQMGEYPQKISNSTDLERYSLRLMHIPTASCLFFSWQSYTSVFETCIFLEWLDNAVFGKEIAVLEIHFRLTRLMFKRDVWVQRNLKQKCRRAFRVTWHETRRLW